MRARASLVAAAGILACPASGCEILAGVHDVSLEGDGGPAKVTADTGAGRDGPEEATAVEASAPDASDAGPADAAAAPDGAAEAGADAAGTDAAGGDGGEGGSLDLIDDMSADDGLILMTEGRNGYWYSYNDGTGTETPPPGSPILPVALSPPQSFAPWGVSDYAMRFYGSNFTKTGGGIGFYFLTPRGSYDASRFAGIQFWAKIGGAGDAALITVEFPSAKTEAAGGICTACSYHFKTAVALSTAWAPYTVPFAQAKQDPRAVPSLSSLDTNELWAVLFEVSPNLTFDVYVADVSFTLP